MMGPPGADAPPGEPGLNGSRGRDGELGEEGMPGSMVCRTAESFLSRKGKPI